MNFIYKIHNLILLSNEQTFILTIFKMITLGR